MMSRAEIDLLARLRVVFSELSSAYGIEASAWPDPSHERALLLRDCAVWNAASSACDEAALAGFERDAQELLRSTITRLLARAKECIKARSLERNMPYD